MSRESDRSRGGDPIAAQLHQRNAEFKQSSEALRKSLLAYFAKWERQHGFKPGAGILLLPAGWSER